MLRCFLVTALFLSLPCLGLAEEAGIRTGTVDTGFRSFTEPIKALRLAFTISGIVETVHVKRGDHVLKGTVLLSVEAREQVAEVDKLKGRLATVDLEIQAAEKSEELAEAEYNMNIQLRDKGAGSHIELQRAKIQHELSQIEESLRRKSKEAIELELRQNEAILDRYALTAPLNGWIEEVIISEGETVERSRPVLALVVTDPLKVDVQVAVRQAVDLKIGDPVWIRSDVDGLENVMVGAITFKAKVADSASDTQTVGIEMPNPKGLDAGLDVVVAFKKPASMASDH